MANPSDNQLDMLTIGEFAERVGRPTASVAAQCFHYSRRRDTFPVAAYVRLTSPAVLWNATPFRAGAESNDPGLLRTDAVGGVLSEVQPFDGFVELRSADYGTLARCQTVQLIDFTEAFSLGARRKRGFPVDPGSAVGGEGGSDATWQVTSIVVAPDDVLVAVASAKQVAERQKWTWPVQPVGVGPAPTKATLDSLHRTMGAMAKLLGKTDEAFGTEDKPNVEAITADVEALCDGIRGQARSQVRDRISAGLTLLGAGARQSPKK